MNLKDKMELAGIKMRNIAKEEQNNWDAAMAMIPPSLYHTLAGPQDMDEAEEANRAFMDAIEEIHHRKESTIGFFKRLKQAGLIEGNIWKGTLRQAGVAASYFADIFQGAGVIGKNGKEYDKYYQYQTQFAKFSIGGKPISVNTLKRYVALFRDYKVGGLGGMKKYGPYESEIELVVDAINSELEGHVCAPSLLSLNKKK